MSDKGYVKTRFESCQNPYEITGYLKHAYMYMGNKAKEQRVLYHYSRIDCIYNILKNRYIWLGSINNMNDYLEREYYNSFSDEKPLFFASFSRFEENLAMYKMYGDKDSGATLKIGYSDMISIVNNSRIDTTDFYEASIVREGKVTDEHIKVNLYLSAVCYKELHSNVLKIGTVSNSLIKEPLNNPELAGFVKLDGWEFEKEVRLCAKVDKKLSPNERIAVRIPMEVIPNIEVIKCPGFDNRKNTDYLSKFKRLGIAVRESEYESLVNLNK